MNFSLGAGRCRSSVTNQQDTPMKANSNKSKNKNDAKCAAQCCAGKCPAECGKSKRGVKEVVEKAKGLVTKVPAFLAKMKRELERLLDLIAKAEAALATISALTARDNKSRHRKALLAKQVKAMKAYADALRLRIEEAEQEGGL